MEFISIKGVAKKLGCSYYVARNRLNRCPDAAKYKHKLEHTVIYDTKVLDVICSQ